MENKREFRGVWIPACVWLDDRLSAVDKIVLAEIDSLDGESGCYASNETLAGFCQTSVPTVSRSINKLKELGYVKQLCFNGRVRILKVCLINLIRQPNQNDEAASSNRLGSNIIYNTNNNTIDKGSVIPAPTPNREKHKHGEYRNVLLTDEEYGKLKVELPDADDYIERLSAYIASTGKSYKSHYATIRNWAARDKQAPKQAPAGKAQEDKRAPSYDIELFESAAINVPDYKNGGKKYDV